MHPISGLKSMLHRAAKDLSRSATHIKNRGLGRLAKGREAHNNCGALPISQSAQEKGVTHAMGITQGTGPNPRLYELH